MLNLKQSTTTNAQADQHEQPGTPQPEPAQYRQWLDIRRRHLLEELATVEDQMIENGQIAARTIERRRR